MANKLQFAYRFSLNAPRGVFRFGATWTVTSLCWNMTGLNAPRGVFLIRSG